MSNPLQLDPRVQKLNTVAKVAGAGVVTVLASGVVVFAGASLAVAGVAAVVGLFVVNFAVPVAARSIALWKQKSLTALTEAFSEETIREDEVNEAERVKVLEREYISSRSNIEGAQEELRAQLRDASEEERILLNGQIEALQDVINEAERSLLERKADLVELQRTNKMYIALHRAGKQMLNAQGAVRNAEQTQQLETARDAIKQRMRAAMAGQKIAQMNQGQRKSSDLLNAVRNHK